MKYAGNVGMKWLLAVLLLGSCATTLAQEAAQRQPEPNTRVPKGVLRYAPTGFPDRIVASPAIRRTWVSRAASTPPAPR